MAKLHSRQFQPEFTGSFTISGSFNVTGPITASQGVALISTSNISGSAVSTGSFGRVEVSTISGDGSALTGVTAGALDIDSATDGTSATVATTDLLLFSDGGTEKKMQMKQMAAPLASVISGSFASVSSSLASRLASEEGEAEGSVVSSSAQIASDISGSLGTNAALIRTLTAAVITGSFTSVSSSLASRLTTEEGEAEGSVVSSSAQIASDISGSFTAASSSFSTRVTTAESELGNTLISGSAQIAADISGSVLNPSGNVSGSSTSTGSFGRTSTTTLDLSKIVGNWTNAGNTVADGGTVTTVDINGGTVDNATIGASTHTTIKGTTIDATTDFTIGATVLTDNQIANDGSFTLDIAGDVSIDADGGDVTFTDNGADLATINSTKISGSATSTGSFGRVEATNYTGDGSGLTGVSGDVNAASVSGSFITTSALSGSTTVISGSSTSTGSFGRVEATAITVSNDLTVTDDLFVDDFARIDALRVGTTSTDPGDGHAYIEGNLTVAGTLTSQEFHTEVTSGSILFTSGSTIFGDSIDDTHEITGSTTISGSLEVQSNVSGSSVTTGSFGRVEASTVTGTLATAAQANVTSVGTLSTLTLGGDLLVPEYIKHVGDTNTFIQFDSTTDRINIEAGGENMIYIVEGSGGDQADKVTINNDLADVDFQVKGDTVEDLIRTNAATDRVGIGTKSPSEFLHISSSGTTKLFVEGDISGSSVSTGSFGRVEATNYTGDGSGLTGISTAGSVFVQTGSLFAGSSDIQITGSLNVSSSVTATNATTSSTAIYTSNVQNGYPTSNEWGVGLGGSYFNNFDNTSHVSEILRFMSGVMSHSLDVSDAAANAKTYGSIDTNENSLGSTDALDGYLPQSYDSSNATMKYLVTKQWVAAGATAFSGISVYHDNGPTHYVDFDSNSTGTGTVSSSADSELFGLGGLSSGAAVAFKVRVVATQSFSDTGSVATPSATSNTFTTQSRLDLTTSAFGTTSGLTLAKINTAQPAVIPAAYQDGKFADVGGTSLSGSLSRKYGATATDFTSVSASGYYNFHDLKVGIVTGSQTVYTFQNGTDKNRFWAPIDQIDSDVGTNSLGIAQVTQSYLTATSRSLSGVPYLSGSTYHVSASVRGLFNPMYVASTTIVDDTIGSVGVGSVATSGVYDVSTSGGTIQTSNAVWSSDSGSVRATSTVPYRQDVVRFNAKYTFSGTTGENINETGVGDTTFTVKPRARNRKNTRSNLATYTFLYHTASSFEQPATSGSMAVYQRYQGYDGGALTGTSEAFTGESFRIQLNNSVLGFNGDAFTTTYSTTRAVASRVIGEHDLQVKPGFLANPSGSYRYWYAEGYGTGSYKYYVRRFQTSGTKTSMTIDAGVTLVNWKATTEDSVAAALLFKSSASGSGTNSELSVARIYDPSEITSNLISSSVAHQADFHLNPFSDALSLYGNTGGSKSSTEYTVPIRNADGIYLDSNDNELYVILRYKRDPSPVTSITLTFS